jgi:hypothetical protein
VEQFGSSSGSYPEGRRFKSDRRFQKTETSHVSRHDRTDILILLLVGALPVTGWHGYGWGPSGVLGVVLVVVLILLLVGRL